MEETDATSIPKTDESKSQAAKHAMTLLRTFDGEAKYRYSTITIEDEGLHALLFQALSHYPFYGHKGPMSITSKFEPVIHNWSLLNHLTENDESIPAVADLLKDIHSADSTSLLAPLKNVEKLQQARLDLKELLELVRDTPGLEDYFNASQNKTDNSVSFDYLWTIFPPGELVFSQMNMGQPQVFIVKESVDWIDENPRRGASRSWSFVCWSYDWDGDQFNRVPVIFTFEDFKGSKSISSLHCYPLKLYRGTSDDNGTRDASESVMSIKDELVKRGKRYRELCLKEQGKQMFEYNGIALARGSGVRNVIESKQVSNSTVDWAL